jgi:hypothetical protein
MSLVMDSEASIEVMDLQKVQASLQTHHRGHIQSKRRALWGKSFFVMSWTITRNVAQCFRLLSDVQTTGEP